MPVTLNDDDPLREQYSEKDGHQGRATRAGRLPRIDVTRGVDQAGVWRAAGTAVLYRSVL
jgi:hypothetical protein